MWRQQRTDGEVFRPFWILPVSMAVAGLLWLGVLIYLMTFDGVPWKTYVSAGAFVAFFALALVYYARSAVYVDENGVTWRGILRTRRLGWRDIRKIDVLSGPITVYAIRTSRTLCHFTSFFRHHRRLAALLMERANLA